MGLFNYPINIDIEGVTIQEVTISHKLNGIPSNLSNPYTFPSKKWDVSERF